MVRVRSIEARSSGISRPISARTLCCSSATADCTAASSCELVQPPNAPLPVASAARRTSALTVCTSSCETLLLACASADEGSEAADVDGQHGSVVGCGGCQWPG